VWLSFRGWSVLVLAPIAGLTDRQHNFFTHAAIAMRPLVLREIADTVELHESTIRGR